jgi:transposase-like protein
MRGKSTISGRADPTGVLRGTNIFNTAHAAGLHMSLEMEHNCPSCGGSTQFWRTASTEVHLGTKTKWRCSECNFGFIQINGIDSTA